MALNFGQNLFPSPAPDVLKNYNFVDVFNSVGYVTLYGGSVASGGIFQYNLSPNIFDSEQVASSAVFSSATEWTNLMTYDFDAKFNLPQALRGTVLATIPHAVRSETGSSPNMRTKVSAQLLQVFPDGSSSSLFNETSGAANFRDSASGGLFTAATSTLPMDIPLTVIKAGDILRLRVKLYGKADTLSGTQRGWIAFNPRNTINNSNASPSTLAWTQGNTALTLQIPLKIDI